MTRLKVCTDDCRGPGRCSPGSAPAPADQGNGNWDPPPVTKPTTQR